MSMIQLLSPLLHLNPLIVSGVLFVGVTIFIVSPWYCGDRRLAFGFLLLMALGAAFRYRLPCGLDARSLLLSIVTFGLSIVFCRFGFAERWLPMLKIPLWCLAVGIMASLLVVGVSYRGGLYLPGRLSPTEFAKPLLVSFLAAWLVSRVDDFSQTRFGLPWPTLKGALGLAFVWGVPVVVGILIRDLGLVLLLCMILVVVLSAATRKHGWLVAGVALASLAGKAVQLFSATAHTRFAVWQNPFADPTGKGWQILQSLNALYAGGMTGMGAGQGSPQFIPIVESDFVYSAFAEDFGLLGCAVLLFLYWVVVMRGMNAGRDTPLNHLFATGLSATLAVQVLLNIAGVIKALPMTGITLPFISHGGMSLVSVSLTAGLLCALSKTERMTASPKPKSKSQTLSDKRRRKS